jgi:hypothetical protein
MSAAVTSIGPLPPEETAGRTVKPPPAFCWRIETVLSWKLPATMSARPSPLKSAAVMLAGEMPTPAVKVCAGWKAPPPVP